MSYIVISFSLFIGSLCLHNFLMVEEMNYSSLKSWKVFFYYKNFSFFACFQVVDPSNAASVWLNSTLQ